jgi:hypothetical protein
LYPTLASYVLYDQHLGIQGLDEEEDCLLTVVTDEGRRGLMVVGLVRMIE